MKNLSEIFFQNYFYHQYKNVAKLERWMKMIFEAKCTFYLKRIETVFSGMKMKRAKWSCPFSV